MKKLKTVFLSADEEYAKRFALRFNECEESPFFLVCADGNVSYGDDDFDAALVDEGTMEITDEEIQKGKKIPVFRLTEDESAAQEKGAGNRVYKYQPVDKIRSAMVNAERKSKKKTRVKRERPILIGLVSLSATFAKTAFLCSLGAYLAEHSKVLFLSLDANDCFSPDPGLSDFLYERTKATGAGKTLSSYLQKGKELFILPPADLPEDLYSLNPERVKKILKEAWQEEAFDVVLLDLGQDARYIESFAPLCKRIYLSSDDTFCPEAKEKRFREWLERLLPEERKRTVQAVRLPAVTDAVSLSEGALFFSEMGAFVRTLISREKA